MKIYNKIIMTVTGEVLEEDSYEYTGKLIQCKGGGSTSTVDYAYNRRMASIAEDQQGKRLGLMLLQFLGYVAEKTGCYKV